MSTEIIIRKAVPEDAPAVFEAHKDSVLNLCAASYTAAQLGTWFQDRTHEIHHPSIASGQLFVAERSGRVLGFFGFCPGEVTLLFVRPEAAGSGLGSRLFSLAVQHAQVGAHQSVFVVATANSQRFYEKHGFTVTDESFFVRGTPEVQFAVFKMQRVCHVPPSNPSVEATNCSKLQFAPHLER